MQRRVPFLVVLAAAVALALPFAPACGSDARSTDTCRQIESARCKRGAECIQGFVGDENSCVQFYDVQCGRGVQDSVKEPSSYELQACLDAISKGSCLAVQDPSKVPECYFLTANASQPDTGAADTSDAASTDTADGAAADTAMPDTAMPDTAMPDTATGDVSGD